MEEDHSNWPLSPDLEYIVVDHFFDDKPTLASCSLVCSRWLPPTRRHLFHSITIEPHKHLCPDAITDFIRALQDSGTRHPEWAIGPCVKKIIVDGRLVPWNLDLGMSTLACPLNLLFALLFRLPRLASLRLSKVHISDDIMLSQEADAGHCDHPCFKLDELVLSDCSAPAHEPHHLLALICMFSNIGSLWVARLGTFRPDPRRTFPPATSSPPIVRSLTIETVSDIVTVRAIYALLSCSLAAPTGHLARVTIHATADDQLSAFSGFAGVAGSLFSELELHVVSPRLLRTISLAPCTALRLLVLHIKCHPIDWYFRVHPCASDLLRAYVDLLHEHRNAFPVLVSVRLGIGRWMLNALKHTAIDETHWNLEETPAGGAQRNWNMWESLDGALREFPALERVEFVMYEEPEIYKTLAEDEKVELRGALEKRLPALWRTQSGAAQLVFEPLGYRFRRYQI